MREVKKRPLVPAAPEPVDTEIYVCNFCNQPFARDYTVLSHIKLKHWSPTLQPRECFLTMKLGKAIMRMPTTKVSHQAVQAKIHGYFTCILCKSMMSREPTAGHICISPEGTLSCVNTCPEGKKLLYTEMNYLFTDKQGYLCDTCGDVFKVPVHLDTHLLKVHGQMTERHKRCRCDICGCTFSLPSHLKKHIVQKHSADSPAQSYMCDICGKEYDRLDSMMTHKRRHHTEGKRFQCEHCPKKFYGRAHWLTHTKQHFGASQHVCPVCNQQFSSNYCLKVHQRKHTGEKPYKCKHCDAAFAQKTSLDVHMKKHQKMKIDSQPIISLDSLGMKKSNAQNGRKSELEDHERGDLERVEKVNPSRFQRLDPTGLERINLDRLGRPDPNRLEIQECLRHDRNSQEPRRGESSDTKRFDLKGNEGFVPLAYKRVDSQNFERSEIQGENRWSVHGFNRSDLFDGRRFDPLGDRRSDSREDSSSEPLENNQPLNFNTGASQIVFPSLSYPGPSYYY